jgi:uncharacterized membrane protein
LLHPSEGVAMSEPELASVPAPTGVGRATLSGLAAAALVTAAIYFGSRRLRDFDAALVAYAGASVFSVFGLGYRYSMWLQRPPTRLYWHRGLRLFLSRLPRSVARLPILAWQNLVAQTFIERRSRLRWVAHLLIAWGCILAAAVTFPLSFGWIRFESALDAPTDYEAFVFGLRVFRFPIGAPIAVLVFNVLDVAAVMVIAGVAVALLRRSRDRGALTVQQFANDVLPLLLLFAVSITGIFLTVSTHLLRGRSYPFLSELHAATVIFTLLYLPFGKFFHVFQRPAQLSVQFYKAAGAAGEQARCARCAEPFASALHVADLKQVEAELGIRYATPLAHYQDVCPACRRKSLALTQDALWRQARGEPLEG